MVNPEAITIYDRTAEQLDEFLVYCVCVAGKRSSTIAPRVQSLYEWICPTGNTRFLCALASMTEPEIMMAVRRQGIGPFTQKGYALHRLAQLWAADQFDPQVCTREQLEGIKWIGSKTACLFLLHSRPGLRVVSLDRHILAYLREQGISAPMDSPPKGSTAYKHFEQAFLNLADTQGRDPAEFDLAIWTERKS